MSEQRDDYVIRAKVVLKCGRCGIERAFPEGIELSCACEGTRYSRHTPSPEELEGLKNG